MTETRTASQRGDGGQREVLRAIEKLRADLDDRLDDIVKLTPRVEKLEDWRILSDSVVAGGLPVRVGNLEAAGTEQRGAIKFLRGALALAVGVLGLLVYVLNIVRGGS